MVEGDAASGAQGGVRVEPAEADPAADEPSAGAASEASGLGYEIGALSDEETTPKSGGRPQATDATDTAGTSASGDRTPGGDTAESAGGAAEGGAQAGGGTAAASVGAGSDDGGNPADEPATEQPKKRFVARLLRPTVLAAAALLLSVLGVAAAAITSAPDDRGGVRAVTARLAGPLTHHKLPEMVADLKPNGRKTHYVQVVAVVEVPEDAVPVLQQHEAPIIAEVQTRLRESERRTLVGAVGVERMREQMISIIDGRIAPHRVHAVLFTRFLLD